MIMNLYVVRDVVAGSYTLTTEAPNDDVAIRDFRNVCKAHKELPIEDYELYRIGHYDTKTGVLRYAEDDPYFLASGDRNYE